ncbi:MAG: hypothetical protein ACUZ8A_06400 [Candidatus Bathyanammoxibius sp.]
MGISIRPGDAVEGGAVPVDRNLTWKECRFNLFDYKKGDGTIVTKPDGTPATTTALRVTLVDDDGTEMEQQYSAGDPERFVPSEDGKTLVAVGSAVALSKSSNLYLLLNALVNAGFPENKIPEDGDCSVFEGLYAYHIGMPMPERSGLTVAEPAAGGRKRIISVPSEIHTLPWDAKKATKGRRAAAAATEAEVTDATADAVALVTSLLANSESVTRQAVATAAIKGKQKAVAKLVFTDEFEVALMANGMSLDGEDITAS